MSYMILNSMPKHRGGQGVTQLGLALVLCRSFDSFKAQYKTESDYEGGYNAGLDREEIAQWGTSIGIDI